MTCGSMLESLFSDSYCILVLFLAVVLKQPISKFTYLSWACFVTVYLFLDVCGKITLIHKFFLYKYSTLKENYAFTAHLFLLARRKSNCVKEVEKLQENEKKGDCNSKNLEKKEPRFVTKTYFVYAPTRFYCVSEGDWFMKKITLQRFQYSSLDWHWGII